MAVVCWAILSTGAPGPQPLHRLNLRQRSPLQLLGHLVFTRSKVAFRGLVT